VPFIGLKGSALDDIGQTSVEPLYILEISVLPSFKVPATGADVAVPILKSAIIYNFNY
jgi:hypothetical protein